MNAVKNRDLLGVMERKNQNKEGGCKDRYNAGVDLNRNFSYKFGLNNNGSSADPCEEDYRGKSAFSEPETQAFRDMFEKYPKIVSAMNFHSYGDLWIRPFNYNRSKTNSILKDQNIMLFNAYLEFEKTAFHPKGAK